MLIDNVIKTKVSNTFFRKTEFSPDNVLTYSDSDPALLC